MSHRSSLFLRGVIFLIGAVVATICLIGLPQAVGDFNFEGYDPILLGLYVPAIPFFFALYQSLKLLGYIDQNQAFSVASVDALRSIKYCGIIIGTLFLLGIPFIFRMAQMDDAPGVAFIGLVIIGASFAVAVAAAVCQRRFEDAITIKTENELTV